MHERLERPLQAASQVFSLRLAGLAGRAGSHTHRGRGSKLTTLGGQGAARTDSRACPTLWLRAQVPQTCALCPVSWLVSASVLALQTPKAPGWTATPWTLQVGTRTKPECWLLQAPPPSPSLSCSQRSNPADSLHFPWVETEVGVPRKGPRALGELDVHPGLCFPTGGTAGSGEISVWCCAPGGGAARSA